MEKFIPSESRTAITITRLKGDPIRIENVRSYTEDREADAFEIEDDIQTFLFRWGDIKSIRFDFAG